MGKIDFKSYICKPFCSFFREGKKEHLACQGAVMIESLVNARHLDIIHLPRNGKESVLWEETDPDIQETVCKNCPFRDTGCDFQSKGPSAYIEPCGGYILLKLLKIKGIIDKGLLESFK